MYIVKRRIKKTILDGHVIYRRLSYINENQDLINAEDGVHIASVRVRDGCCAAIHFVFLQDTQSNNKIDTIVCIIFFDKNY